MNKKITQLVRRGEDLLARTKSEINILQSDDLESFDHSAVDTAIKHLLDLKVTLCKIRTLDDLRTGVVETD